MQALFVAWYNFARKHETLKGQNASDGQQLNGPRMDDQRTDRESGEVTFAHICDYEDDAIIARLKNVLREMGVS